MKADLPLYFRSIGKGETLILVHGTPSSSLEFVPLMQKLQDRFHCLAPDHLGFGQSPKPFEADYSLTAHARRFEKWFLEQKIEKFHVLIHDFGAAIALPTFMQNWENILSMNIVNSWFWPLSETEPTLNQQKWLLNSKLMQWLYRYGNFSAKFLVPTAWGTHKPLRKEQHQEFLAAFPDSRSREGTIGFLKALLDSGDPHWRMHEELASLPPKPTRIFWGEADKLLGSATRKRWQELLPHASYTGFSDVGHFACMEAPEFLAREI